MTTNDRRNFAEIAEYRARSAAARLVHYADEAAPHSTAVAPAEVLYNAADEIRDLIDERDAARAHRAYLWGACIAFFLMLLWSVYWPARPAPCTSIASDVMQLDPTEIRAVLGNAEWL